MLAFSSLAQIGELVAILGVGTVLATDAALLHVTNHAVMKTLLFYSAGAFIMMTGIRRIADLSGLGHVMPFSAGAYALASFAIMGLPPFSGFISKFLMIYAAASGGHLEVAATILFGGIIGLVYYTRGRARPVLPTLCRRGEAPRGAGLHAGRDRRPRRCHRRRRPDAGIPARDGRPCRRSRRGTQRHRRGGTAGAGGVVAGRIADRDHRRRRRVDHRAALHLRRRLARGRRAGPDHPGHHRPSRTATTCSRSPSRS